MYIYHSFRFSVANTNNINRENVAVEPSALIAAWQTKQVHGVSGRLELLVLQYDWPMFT